MAESFAHDLRVHTCLESSSWEFCLGLKQAATEAEFLPDFFQSFLVQGLEIVGWVVLWTPIGIFLYDWWPHRQDVHVYERIRNMSVEITSESGLPG